MKKTILGSKVWSNNFQLRPDAKVQQVQGGLAPSLDDLIRRPFPSWLCMRIPADLGRPPSRLACTFLPLGLVTFRSLTPDPWLSPLFHGNAAVLSHSLSHATLHVCLPVSRVAQTAHTSPPSLVCRPRSPCPASTAHNRQVIPAEREEGTCGPDEEAKQNVEAVVPKVEPSRGRDKDGSKERHQCQHEQVQRRCCGLMACRREERIV